MVTEDGLTLGGDHIVQYTDLVSQKCTLKTYIILLTNVPPINTIKTNTTTKNKPQKLPHTYQMSNKRNKNTHVGEDVEKLETSYIASRNVKCCSYCGKHLPIPQKLNRSTSLSSQFHT